MNKTIKYILSIIGVQLIGFSGSLLTTSSIKGWYTTIAKPSFNPPNWIFGPVWTLLFLLIGVSLGMVLNTPKETKYRKEALIAFAAQLILNVGWSYCFFYLQRPGLAVIEILILVVSIIANIYFAGKVNKTAGWLLVPYLLWVSFATFLNFTIWRINS